MNSTDPWTSNPINQPPTGRPQNYPWGLLLISVVFYAFIFLLVQDPNALASNPGNTAVFIGVGLLVVLVFINGVSFISGFIWSLMADFTIKKASLKAVRAGYFGGIVLTILMLLYSFILI